MRAFKTREFDHGNAPKVRPPANPRALLRQAYSSSSVRATARPDRRKPAAGELVAPPAPSW